MMIIKKLIAIIAIINKIETLVKYIVSSLDELKGFIIKIFFKLLKLFFKFKLVNYRHYFYI